MKLLPLPTHRPTVVGIHKLVVLVLFCSLVLGSVTIAEQPASAVDPPERPLSASDREHWSFRPLTRPQVPGVKNQSWPRNAIDRFILEKIERAGLTPMPPANRYTLIRRVTFDLTGLPPTAEEINAFVNDPTADAYEKLVDRLLASTAYGERWAQHWLDLARFAETDGFEHDHVRPNAWRYRDWVIDALNDDVPFDDFVRLQLAGDELFPNQPSARIATGFLLCGPDMPDINLQQERRHNFLNDMTATVGSVFLGLQIGCAQCHEHKFDPISQHDFYRLRAFFENAEIFREHPIPSSEDAARLRQFEITRADEWKRLADEIKQTEQDILQRVRKQRKEPDLDLNGEELLKQATSAERKRHAGLSEQLKQVKKRKPPRLAQGRVMLETTARPKPSHLWIRGDFRRQGPELSPGFPRIADPANGSVQPAQTKATTSGRRSQLADWLVRPDNPLSTRVIVNRVWQFHFGRGLSSSPSNFGTVGDEPTHPQLLDWLAMEFPRLAWSMKRLHRLMVTSATYQQASRPPVFADNQKQTQLFVESWRRSLKEDPENELLARMRRRRMEGEAIRDSMLAASNSLTQRRRGPGVRPPLPKELLVTLLKNQWNVTENVEDHRRRSVYLFVRRNLRYPIFDVFDKPDTNASCSRRNRSTIAPQALMLLNSKLSLDAARRMSGFLIQRAGRDRSRQIELCYLRTLGRKPTVEESELGIQFLTENTERLRNESRATTALAVPNELPQNISPHAAAALTDFCLAIFNLNEFVYVD